MMAHKLSISNCFVPLKKKKKKPCIWESKAKDTNVESRQIINLANKFCNKYLLDKPLILKNANHLR